MPNSKNNSSPKQNPSRAVKLPFRPGVLEPLKPEPFIAAINSCSSTAFLKAGTLAMYSSRALNTSSKFICGTMFALALFSTLLTWLNSDSGAANTSKIASVRSLLSGYTKARQKSLIVSSSMSRSSKINSRLKATPDSNACCFNMRWQKP